MNAKEIFIVTAAFLNLEVEQKGFDENLEITTTYKGNEIHKLTYRNYNGLLYPDFERKCYDDIVSKFLYKSLKADIDSLRPAFWKRQPVTARAFVGGTRHDNPQIEP